MKNKKTKKQSNKFSTALNAEADKLPYTNGVDDGQYNDGQLEGFIKGADWAYEYIRANPEVLK